MKKKIIILLFAPFTIFTFLSFTFNGPCVNPGATGNISIVEIKNTPQFSISPNALSDIGNFNISWQVLQIPNSGIFIGNDNKPSASKLLTNSYGTRAFGASAYYYFEWWTTQSGQNCSSNAISPLQSNTVPVSLSGCLQENITIQVVSQCHKPNFGPSNTPNIGLWWKGYEDFVDIFDPNRRPFRLYYMGNTIGCSYVSTPYGCGPTELD